MGMIEIKSKEHGGGIGRAIKNFRESLECLKDDFDTMMDEFEDMGERDDRYDMGDYDRKRYRDDREWRDDEPYGERRGGRRRRY